MRGARTRYAGLRTGIGGSPCRERQVSAGQEEDGGDSGSTLVMSVVAASISRSSALRSAKPGRTCFACSLSSRATAELRSARAGHERDRQGDETRTFRGGRGEEILDLLCVVDPGRRT